MIFSEDLAGHETTAYNWVDFCQVAISRVLGSVLVLFYGRATLFNHLAFVAFADSSSKETVEERWADTPTEARGAVVSAGGWAVCYGLTLFCMTIFEPGCQHSLCITLTFCMGLWWQACWYVGMLGQDDVDVDDKRKVLARSWFLTETIASSCICGGLAFFAQGAASLPAPSWTALDLARVWFVRCVGTLLTLLYGTATLRKHTMFVKEFAKPLEIEGSRAEDIWCKTPVASKAIAVQSGGWCVCFSATVLAMTFLEPGCERGLCKCWALAMLWWNCVWYGGMFNRIDFNDHRKRPWTNWLKAESMQEIALFSIAGVLGFIAD